MSLEQTQLLSPNTYDQDLITARTHSLTELAKSIAGLAELFKDLSVLIIDQGTLLDSVEYNIEQTAVRVGEAVVVLEEAKGYQGRTGRRRCILLLVLLVIAVVVVLVIKIRGRGKGASHGISAPTSDGKGGNRGIPAVNVGPRSVGALNLDPWELGRPPISSRVVGRSTWSERMVPPVLVRT